MATWDLREAVATSAKTVPAGTNEFDLAGVTAEPSVLAPAPRVKESPCHLECGYLQTIRPSAATAVATVDLVIGRVEHVHIADEALTPDGRVDITAIRLLARLDYYDHTTVNHVFEMITPGADADKLAGLEGTSIIAP